jgi:hypothetical protein
LNSAGPVAKFVQVLGRSGGVESLFKMMRLRGELSSFGERVVDVGQCLQQGLTKVDDRLFVLCASELGSELGLVDLDEGRCEDCG